MYIPRHQKTYLSRAMTRAMALDHPIGDPHGGPAYGERSEPVSAILAIGTMLASGSAIAASGLTLLTGLAFAGGALSLIGNITGNKTLSKIGMVAGLAGGIGALAESAGMFASSAAEAAGGAGAVGLDFEGATAALSQTPTAQMPEVLNLADDALASMGSAAPDVSNGLIQNASASLPDFAPGGEQLVNSAAPSAPPSAAAPSASPALSQSAPTTALDPLTAAPSAPATPDALSPSFTGNAVPNAAGPGQPGAGWQYFDQGAAISPTGQYFQNGAQVTGAGGGPMGFSDYAGQALQGLKSAGGSMMDLAKTNPGAAYMLGSAATGAIDWASGKTEAQINEMEARGELSKAQADKIRYEIELAKRRQANLNNNYANVPNPLTSWTPNFQTVPPGQQPGLISGSMTPPRG